MDLIWQDLVENPRNGITTLVHTMSAQVENAVVDPSRVLRSESGYESAMLF